MNTEELRYKSFQEFWPFYLNEHSKTGTRILHFTGTSLLFPFLGAAILKASLFYLVAAIVSAYGCAWIGHFFIEKNRPATFRYPLYSLLADFKMYGLMWTGKLISPQSAAEPHS